MILPFTVGREKEIDVCLRAVQEGRNLLLTGPSGCGKTHILIESARRLKASDVAARYIESPTPALDVTEGIYDWLTGQAGIARPRRIDDSRVHLTQAARFLAEVLALPALTKKTLVLLADSFDQIQAPALPVWEILAEKCVVIAAGFKEKPEARSAKLLHRFDLLEIGPLSSSDARGLAEKILETTEGVTIDSDRTREFLLRHIATLSNGSPRAVVEGVSRLRGAERIDENYVRNIPPHRSGASLGDATPMLLLLGLVFLIARLYARGMYMLDAWAIFGSFAALFGYLGLYLRHSRRKIS